MGDDDNGDGDDDDGGDGGGVGDGGDGGDGGHDDGGGGDGRQFLPKLSDPRLVEQISGAHKYIWLCL